jgi:SNF2 family DNA or RNA helicase
MIENEIGDEILATGCNYSSKLDKIVDKVLENKSNSKGKLIFSQFREEMDTLKRLLVEGGIQSVEILDGRTVKSERNKILGEKYDVLILQMKTGSEGLNLQEHYSEIYFTSPSWNPYVEDQAIGRCHRLGQLNEVVVFKFKMTNGIEEASMTIDGYVTEVQETKRSVASSIYERI